MFKFTVSVKCIFFIFFRDREGQQLAEGWDTAKKDFRDKALHLAAIQLIKTGDMTKVVDKQGTVSEKGKENVQEF